MNEVIVKLKDQLLDCDDTDNDPSFSNNRGILISKDDAEKIVRFYAGWLKLKSFLEILPLFISCVIKNK